MYNAALEARKQQERKQALVKGRARRTLLPASGLSSPSLPSAPDGTADGQVQAAAGRRSRQGGEPPTQPMRGHEYLANGTFRNVQPVSPTPAYLSSTTVFCGTILCHHRKPERELGDYRVSSLQYEPEYRRVNRAIDEASRSMSSVGGGPYVDPAVPASNKYCAFRPRNKDKELAKSTF